MDEKKLHDSYRKISVWMRNGAFAFSMYILAFLIFASNSFAADLEPYETSGSTITPVLSGIQVTQMGGSALLVNFRGREIPLPRVVSAPGDAKLVLQWDGIRFPQNTDKEDWWDSFEWDVLNLAGKKDNTWWKQYEFPLLNRINAEPVGKENVKLTFTSSKSLMVDKVEGVAGADNISLVLKVYEPPKESVAVKTPVVYAKGDPMGIKEPVTLHLSDAGVKSVFRMLADIQRLNLLLDPSVPDMAVTIAFDGVPFNEAFGYLLRMTDLTYSMVGGTLVVGKVESIGKTLGREVVRAYNLSYAVNDTGQIQGDITAALTGLITLSKPPTLDQRNRMLYVTATPEQHEEVAALLTKLDQPGKQIMLHAQIVEVSDTGRQQLETLVSGVYDQWLFNFSNGALSTGYNYSNLRFEPADLGLPIGGGGTGDSTDNVWDNITIDGGAKLLTAGLNALESSGKGKVLARPSVITIDGKEARVALTQNYKYVSGVDSNGNTTFSEVNAGPTLNFTPVIGRNGVITIKLQISTGAITAFHNAGNGAQAPETTSRTVSTVVRVRNGEPFAVGGLFEESKTKNRSRLPVLGYIPLLGDLFTTRNDDKRKSEVAMIVIPYILDVPDEDIATFDLQKSSLTF